MLYCSNYQNIDSTFERALSALTASLLSSKRVDEEALSTSLSTLNVEALLNNNYCKDPKFTDARKLCCNLPKIQTKRPNLRVFCQKDANGIENSEDPDQTAPQGAV